MHATIVRSGDGVAVQIPEAFVQELCLEADALMHLHMDAGQLVMRPLTDSERLDLLISQITPENRHDETDWGPPVGNEVW